MAGSEEDVNVKFGATIDGALDGINNIVDALQGMEGPIGALAAHFVELGEALIAAFAIEKVAEFVTAIAEVGENLNHLAIGLGITATEFTKLAGVAELANVSTEQFGSSMTRMERAIAQAATGSGAAYKAFQDLNVKVTDAHGNMRSLADILPDVAEGFKNNTNHMQAVADVMAIGGRGMKNMIPLFAEGKEGIEEMGKAVEATGTVMNNAMTQGFEETADKAHLFHMAIDGVKITLAEAFKPAVDTLYDSLTNFIEAMNRSLQTGGLLNYALEALVIAFDAVITVVDALATFVVELVQAFDTGVKTIVQILGILDKVIGDVLSGHWVQAYADAQKGLNDLGQLWSDYFTELAKQEEAFDKRLKQTWSNIGFGGVNTGDRTPDPASAGGGKPRDDGKGAAAEREGAEKVALAKIAAEEAADRMAYALGMETIQQLYEATVRYEEQKFQVKRQKLEAEIADSNTTKEKRIADQYELQTLEVNHIAQLDKLYAEKLDKERQLRQQDLSSFMQAENDKLKSGLHTLDEDYKNHKITLDEKIRGEKELTNTIIQEQIRRLEAERSRYIAGTNAYREYTQKIEQLERTKTDKINQANDEWERHQTQVSDRVAREFGSTLSTMLTTTQTWQQQVVAVLNRLVDIFIQEVVEPMIASWIRSELMKTTATEAGEQARVVAKSTASAEGAVAEKAGSLASIMQSAYKAAAATWASVSEIPVVGPFLAPPAAAAAFVAVAAFGNSLPSAAGGMVVQEDTLAQVHKNEMVLPAHLSSGLAGIIAANKGGRTGGGGDLYYQPTVNHNEPASLHQMLTDEAATMRAWLTNQTRDGQLPFGA